MPEDPISQLSLSLEESLPKTNGKKIFRRLDINVRRGKGFGTIDISEFRMPTIKAVPGNVQRQRTSSHSDGFVGHEAVPIGRPMPVRKQHRHPQVWHKLIVRMGELTLVTERQFGESVQERQSQARPHKKAAKKPRPYRAREDIVIAHQGCDAMLVNVADNQSVSEEEVLQNPQNESLLDVVEQMVSEDEAPKQQQNEPLPHAPEQTTSKNASSETSVLDLPSRSSPLRQKEIRNRKVTFEEGNNSHDQPSRTASIQLGRSFGRGDSNEVSVPQQLKMISAPKKPATPQKKDIEVLQQLMMVTIPRSSVKDSDSEDDSDVENCVEDKSESERSADSDEEDGSDTPEEDSGEEGDDESENEVEDEEEDVEMVHQEDGTTASAEATEHIQLPYSSEIELQIPEMKVAIPTLHREDAQNPILEMSPRHLLNSIRTPLGSVTRRRSSRLQRQQELHSVELFSNSIDNTVVEQPQTSDENKLACRRSAPVRNNNDDNSWRPREPATSSMPMELEDDEIVNSPSPVTSYINSFNSRSSARRLSQIANQALQLVTSYPRSPQHPLPNNYDSQISMELGNTQRLLRGSLHAYILETQFIKSTQELDEEQEGEERDVPLSQADFVPEIGYFERASQQLQQPSRKPNVVRTKSMPASMHGLRAPERGELMAGGITIAAASHYTILQGRSKSSGGGMDTLMSATRRQERSLKTLTRQASKELGTLPSGRKRMMNLPFQPPFKKEE